MIPRWVGQRTSGVEIHEIELDHEEYCVKPVRAPVGEQLEACIRSWTKRTAESAFQPPEASLISNHRVSDRQKYKS